MSVTWNWWMSRPWVTVLCLMKSRSLLQEEFWSMSRHMSEFSIVFMTYMCIRVLLTTWVWFYAVVLSWSCTYGTRPLQSSVRSLKHLENLQLLLIILVILQVPYLCHLYHPRVCFLIWMFKQPENVWLGMCSLLIWNVYFSPPSILLFKKFCFRTFSQVWIEHGSCQ